MTTARTIITLALEAMNRLAPGEALDADLAAVCLRRLNAIADDWSARRDLLPVASFAELDTANVLPAGYQGALAAALAVALAPALLGGATPSLLMAEKKAMFNVANNILPAVISANPLAPRCDGGNIMNGWS